VHTPDSVSITVAEAAELWIDQGGEASNKSPVLICRQDLKLRILPYLSISSRSNSPGSLCRRLTIFVIGYSMPAVRPI
jgi:hypothetical protein